MIFSELVVNFFCCRFPTRVPCAICCGLTLMTAAAGVFLREGLATPSVRCVLVASRFSQELWTSFKKCVACEAAHQ